MAPVSSMVNLSVTTNGETILLPKGFKCSNMRLWDYHFYSNDTVINQYNNSLEVNGTTYTLTIGNYSSSASVFASYLSTVLAAENITVTYDGSITGKLTFTTSVPWTVMNPFTLSISANAKGLYGLSSTFYTRTSGTTFVSDFPVHFTNSDYYFVDIKPTQTYEYRVPDSLTYAYKVVSDVQPGDIIYHKLQEPLPFVSCSLNTVTYIKITIFDQYGVIVPCNGSTWNFFLELVE